MAAKRCLRRGPQKSTNHLIKDSFILVNESLQLTLKVSISFETTQTHGTMRQRNCGVRVLKSNFLAVAYVILLPSWAGAEAVTPEDTKSVVFSLISESYLPEGHDQGWNDAAIKALKQYEKDWQMPVTGVLTQDLAKHIRRDHPDTQSGWIQDANGCAFWNQSPNAQETVTWTGTCTDGKGSGRGIQIFHSIRNGTERVSSYFGQMQSGKANGQGRYHGRDGFTYEGEFFEDAAHGQGRMRLENGAVIVGTFKNNLAHGEGEMFWPWGEHYKGMFVDGQMHGQGTLTFDDGKVYTGTLVAGFFKGQGKLTYPNGDGYEGKWAGDRPHGQGIGIVNGERFEGVWKNSCLPLEGGYHTWINASKQQCEAQDD